MYRSYCMIAFLVSLLIALAFMVVLITAISDELHIINLERHGNRTEGEILTSSRDDTVFVGRFMADGRSFEFVFFDREGNFDFRETVTIIYDRNNPRNYVVEGFTGSNWGGTAISVLLFLMMFGCSIVALHEYFKVGFVLRDADRVLCEPVDYIPRRSFYGMGMKCKIPGDKSNKIYKGACKWAFPKLMKKHNLKYIPLYISRTKKKAYYVNCDEAMLIVERGSYNGYTIEELQGKVEPESVGKFEKSLRIW